MELLTTPKVESAGQCVIGGFKPEFCGMRLSKCSDKMLSYTPIAISKYTYCIEDLINLFEQLSHRHHHGIWDCVPLIGQVENCSDFLSEQRFEHAWKIRYSGNFPVFMNPYLPSFTQKIFEQMNQLPFSRITHAQILRQTKNVAPHYDLAFKEKHFIDDCKDFNQENEPALYKIVLNDTIDANCFYLTLDKSSPRNYIQLPCDTNVFCIREKNIMHGSDFNMQNKFIVSIFGHIDKNQHRDLIQESLTKYSKYTIYL